MDHLEFTVAGKPTGKGRPRVTRHGTFTPQATVDAEERVRWSWRIQTGSSRVVGPVEAYLELVVERDDEHWDPDGELLATAPAWPEQKPDVDNALKLVLDALNGLAYADDVSVVRAQVVRRYANPGEDPHTLVRLTPAALTLREAA